MSQAKREEISSSGPHGPWRGYVKVHALKLVRARNAIAPAETVFEVEASWTGPPAIGFPPSDTPVETHDVYVVGADLQLARAVALIAAEQLRAAREAPDIRDLAKQFRARLAAGPYG